MNKIKRERLEKKKKDKQWAEAIRARDKVCQICGADDAAHKGKYLNSHHIVPRTFEKLRWDTMNGILLCVKCHKWGSYSAHKNGFWFTDWLSRNKIEQYNYLIWKM